MGSFAAGVFALLPYFALWDAPKQPLELPPKKEDLVRAIALRPHPPAALPPVALAPLAWHEARGSGVMLGDRRADQEIGRTDRGAGQKCR